MSLAKEQFKKMVQDVLEGATFELKEDLGDIIISINCGDLKNILTLLKTKLGFDMLLSVTAIDHMDDADERFEVVYHILSLSNRKVIRVKAFVSEKICEVDSVVDLWSGANFMEREVWDMYGIKFAGHPDLRRILMYDEFVGHPLRKDYPLQAKQPRVRLIHPEVSNTARDMLRNDLVQINKSKINSPQIKDGPQIKNGN